MKKLTYLFALMLIASLAIAQAPQGMNYQAVARNASGAILTNQSIGVRITVTNGSGGATLYQETHSAKTNQFGLFTLNVGNGNSVNGIFANIPWATVTPWLQVEMDATGGTNYVLMGSSQLLSVPYAIQSENTSGIQSVPVSPTPPLAGEVLKYNGTAWAPAPTANGLALAADWNTLGNSGTDTSNFIGTTDNVNLTFRTNNVKRMTLTTSGRLGIGTTSPGFKLDVSGTGRFTGALKIGTYTLPSTDGTSGQVLKTNGTGTLTWSSDNNTSYTAGTGISFSGNTINSVWTATGNNISSNNTGNVGVGTSAPGDKLSVRGGALSFHRPVSNDVPYVGIDYDTTADGMRFRANNSSSALNQTNMFITRTNGNVGIGTTSPSLARLQVEGMVGNTVAILKGNSTSKGVSIIADYPGIFFNSYFNGGVKTMAASGYSSFINTDQANGSLTFSATNVANITANAAVTVPERVRITGAGNVGIGTNTPISLLHLHSAVDQPLVRFTSPTTGTTFNDGFIIGHNNTAGEALIWNWENQDILFGTNGNEIMRLRANGKLQYEDGNEGAGKVLTSDASGNASWQGGPPVAFQAFLWFNGVSGNSANFFHITFDSVGVNTGNGYDVATGIFTAPSAGMYNFYCQIQWVSTFNNGAAVYIRRYNANDVRGGVSYDNIVPFTTMNVSGNFYLNVGDQIEFGAAEGGTGAQTITNSRNYSYVYGYKVY